MPAPSAQRLLFVEDEQRVAAPIKRGLEEEGYVVHWTQRGDDGLTEALTTSYDLMVVDWRLPGMDGCTLVARLRDEGRSVPILMLTALGDVDHRVAGLDAGADDYLTKPFSFEELLARLRAITRRHREDEDVGMEAAHVQVGALRLDAKRRRVVYGAERLELRPKAFRLLEVLLRNEGEVVTRTLIAERVWGSPFDVTANAIDVTVSALRKALKDAEPVEGGAAVVVETERGIGYRLSAVS